MTEPIEYVVCARQGGKRAAMEAKAAELLAAGWTEVTNDPAYGPPDPRLRKFNRPGAERRRCDESCACPADGRPMYYAPRTGLHACQDPDCDYAHPKETL
jgi:hypothetical protein